jgi:hypothetical protein
LAAVNFHDLQPFPAVVAHLSTSQLVEVFSEEVKLHLPPAEVGLLTVVENCVKRVNVFIFPRARALLVRYDEKIVTFAVAIGIVQDTLGFLLVSASAAALLDVTFEALGHRVVNDEANVAFVDAHPECDGGNYNMDLVLHPPLLHLLPPLRSQLRVVKVTMDAIILREYLRELLTFFAGDAVDDARLGTEAGA